MIYLEPFMQTVLQISISMAAVIGFLLLLIPVWQQRYSARWRKVIWLVIALRLLIPVSIELPVAPVQMNMDFQRVVTVHSQPDYLDDMPAMPEHTAAPSDLAVNSGIGVAPSDVTVQNGMVWSQGVILSGIWIAGVLAFVLWHGVQYVIFRRKVFASAMPLEDGGWLLKNAGGDMDLHRLPDILISAEVQSPMLAGFSKPVILLPERIYGEQELLLILRHELMHYKHHDLWYKLLLLAANAVHWFNPLVWLMLRQAGRDVEQVCDENVVAGQDMAYRKAYSMTILNTMASQKGIALSTCLSKDAQNVKKRFAGILQPKQYKRGAVVFCGIVLLTALASGCLQFTEPEKDTKPEDDYLPGELTLGDTMMHEQQSSEIFWTYTGYLDTFPWENSGETAPFSCDYDSDGKTDRVYRSEVQDEGYYQYQIEFSSGEVLKIEEPVSNIGFPQVDGVDLTGDGENEIIFQVGYPTSTNPLACGELVVYEKQKGVYQPIKLPFASGSEQYQQMLPVTYSKADGQAVKVSVPGTDFTQIVPIENNDLWNGYQYSSTYTRGETMQHCIWAYKIRNVDGKSQLICSIQLFDKWSDDGLDIALACKNGELVIDEIQYCDDVYTDWLKK